MKTIKKTVTFEYAEYEIGDMIQAASPRSELPPGIHRVTRFSGPLHHETDDGVVFIEGHEQGFFAEHVMIAGGKDD